MRTTRSYPLNLAPFKIVSMHRWKREKAAARVVRAACRCYRSRRRPLILRPQLERPALGSNRSGIERSRYCGAHIEILWLLPERMWMLKPIPQTGVSDGRVEPFSPPHDRGHDGPEYVARDPAILHQRGFKVQPLFW